MWSVRPTASPQMRIPSISLPPTSARHPSRPSARSPPARSAPASAISKSGPPPSVSGDAALGGKKITGLAAPTAAQEAATKAYVDAIAQGLTVKASVRVATTSNITLSGTQTIDGVAATAGDRVLVKNQTTATENCIYVVAAGAWSRSTDADQNSEVVSGMYAFVTEGTAYANTGWSLITPDPITLDLTSLTFTQFSGSAVTVMRSAVP